MKKLIFEYKGIFELPEEIASYLKSDQNRLIKIFEDLKEEINDMIAQDGIVKIESNHNWEIKEPITEKPIQSMILTLEFDREIDKHYISPGRYSIKMKDGEIIDFDFLDSEKVILEDGKSIEFHLSNPDIESFPNMKKLYPNMIEEFVEIHVYTGEYDDPEINVHKICGIEISDGETDYIFNMKCYSKMKLK